ncbi:MAG: protein kinase [Ahniella sp.]|nr:protein kinase [Ahniella sp.]
MTLEHTLTDELGADLTSDSRRVGHFRLLRRIGAGGFGTVHEAWDMRLNRAVALKVLHRPGAEALNRLLSEARACAGLDHRAFVHVLEVFDEDDQVALVMELVRGHTLGELLQSGPMPVARALQLTQQVARAMASAHRLGRVHGDLKPANLMVDHEGRVRILDFGLAREHGDHGSTLAGHSEPGAGTLAYMAPELLLGAAPHAGSDAYALGMVLGELLAGRRPFAAFEGGLLAHAIVHGQQNAQESLDTLPEGIRTLLDDLCRREPQGRLSDMDTLTARIDDLLGERRRSTEPALPPVLAPVTPPPRRFGRWFWIALLLIPASLLAIRWPIAALSDHWQFQELKAAEALLVDFEQPGHLERAIKSLEGLLERRPNHAAAAADLAIAYCLQYAGDARDEAWLQRASASARIALDADDQLARSHSAFGWSEEFHGRRDIAVRSFERALGLDPGDRYALIGLARVQTRLGAYAKARAVLDEAMRMHPQDRVFVDALGTWFFRQAQYADAERMFRQSIALSPDSVAGYANLNAVLLRQGRNEDALAVLQQGLRVRPDGQLYSNLGTVLYMLGRYSDAAQAFERSVSPTHGSPNDYLRWANLADALRQIPGRKDDSLRAYTTTITLLTPILERTPDDVTLLSRAALYRAKLDQCPRAMSAAAQVRNSASEQADVWFRLAQANELCSHREIAIADLAQARRAGYPLNLIQSEPDLIALRRDPMFQRQVLGQISGQPNSPVPSGAIDG